MKPVIRLMSMEISNIKNVRYGKLEIEQRKRGSILGIYGQNGSGKTVVVDCMVLLKYLLTGRQIPAYFYYYINSLCNTGGVKYMFATRFDNQNFLIEYEVKLQKTTGKGFCISEEKLSQREDIKGKRMTPVFEYSRGRKEFFRPLKYYSYFEKNIKDIIALGIAQQATENFNEEQQVPEVSSFLFSRKAQETFKNAAGEAAQISFFSEHFQKYGLYELAVVENTQYGFLSLNLGTIPINIDWPEKVSIQGTGILLRLTDVNVVPKEIYPYVANTIKQINIVMKSLVPDINIEIYNAFDKLMENGSDGIQFEVVTMRGDSIIPLLYESAGIKKLISICSNLVACYNRESYCLVVDELDSGIYEYLLGECLDVMQEKAKGQLIFTSHNLRPLEVLDNENLIYTTVNPDNRYIKSAYIKNTQNMRLSYLRTIKLGGQKEKLYNETNIYDMELALRRAGKVEVHD